jgi:hypothetical protein
VKCEVAIAKLQTQVFAYEQVRRPGKSMTSIPHLAVRTDA